MIVQADIETAIRNYILSQINVKEGMEITVDLAATRGASGFTATINIVRSATLQKPAAQHQVYTPAPVETVQAMPPEPVAVSRVSPFRVQPREEVVAAPAPMEEEVAETTQEQPEAPTVTTGTDEAQPEPEEPKPLGKSLFKSMRKPVNS